MRGVMAGGRLEIKMVNILVNIEQMLLKTSPMCRSMQDVSNNIQFICVLSENFPTT